MDTEVDGAVMADSEVRSARTTFAFFERLGPSTS